MTTRSQSAPSAGPARTVFFGSGAFGVPILDALRQIAELDLVAVVSVPDRPAGRARRLASPPVVEHARALGLAILQPERLRDEAAIGAIEAQRPDLAILADYGRLVPQPLLEIPKLGFLNVHPSLLPRHRGATPIEATILAGDSEAGVSLFEMDAGLDTGAVVAQARWALIGDETAAELEAEASRRGAVLLRETLPGWLAGECAATPQPSTGVTLSRPLRREDGWLDPNAAADVLARRVRAFQPWPGTYLLTPAGRLAVLRAEAKANHDLAATGVGRLVADGDGLALTTSSGLLRLLEVRPAGGRSMTGAELRRGRPALVGAAVG